MVKPEEMKSKTDEEQMIVGPVMISDGSEDRKHVLLSNEDTKEKTSGGEETGRGKKKGKGKKKAVQCTTTQNATSSASKGKDKKKVETASPSKGKDKKKAGTTPNATSSAAIEGGDTPIWFTLIASKHQDTNAPLQQIPSRYLRVKNGNMHVSYIKKYIAMKLSLESEDEVELYQKNLPLDSSIMLKELLQYWMVTTPIPERVDTRAGCSAAEYVMVLSYGRRTQPLT